MKKIYVCSRYRAESGIGIFRNIQHASSYCREIALNGDIPVAPHIYFPQFLRDANEEERNIAMSFNRQLIKECDEMHVINTEPSEGMLEEINFAIENQIPFKYVLWKS